jgi:hypothetical protein
MCAVRSINIKKDLYDLICTYSTMTIKTSGALSISDIKAEFGGDATPSLSEYYSGGSYVLPGTLGYPGGVATTIPSSGQISMRNFYGAMKEASAVTILQDFWNNRTQYIRAYSPSTDVYPGDDLWVNTSYTRYNSSYTTNWTWNITTPVLSRRMTTLTYVMGLSGSTITSSTNNYSGAGAIGSGTYTSAVDNRNYVARSHWINNTNVQNLTNSSVTWSRSSNNRGNWPGQFNIQGAWDYSEVVVPNGGYNRVVFAGTESEIRYWDVVLQPGQFLVFIVPTVYSDSRYRIPVPSNWSALSLPTISWSSNWYNAYSMRALFNTSNSNIYVDWKVAQYVPGYETYSGYVSGGLASTPEFSFANGNVFYIYTKQ